MDKKLTIINIALVVVAIFLAYMVYHSISQPVIFENTKLDRELKVVQNLKDIEAHKVCSKKTTTDTQQVSTR